MRKTGSSGRKSTGFSGIFCRLLNGWNTEKTSECTVSKTGFYRFIRSGCRKEMRWIINYSKGR